MKAAEILKMVEDAFRDHCFIIDVIVSDNDRTMRSMLKHTLIGSQVRVLESFKGNLD